VKGGKTGVCASVDIVMLESRFALRPVDFGNAATWPFPGLYRVVRGASPDRVVRRRAEGLLDAFVAAAQDLVREGADGITTNCGFLSLYQHDLAKVCGVPVASSSLMQVPFIQRLLPLGRRVGVVTISAETLEPDHLTAAGCDPETPIAGTDPDGAFSQAILGDRLTLDVEQAEADVLKAAQTLMTNHDDIGALVLECTNMVPYAAYLRERLGVPVYSGYSFVTWFQSGLLPARFSRDLGDPRN